MSGFAVRKTPSVTHDHASRHHSRVQTGLVFRPRFHLQGGLVGIEAAAVRPGAFGLVSSRDVARDRTMLRQACHLATERGAMAPLLSVAVTEAQAACGMLACLVGDLLNECRLPPDRLELEFCDDSLHGDESNLLHLLAALDGLGVRLVLAGFGGGISEAARLRRRGLAGLLSGVRLHPSLVDGLDAASAETQSTRGLVAAAHALGLTVIAGNIDSAVQARRLEESGCDEGAGAWLGAEQGPSDTMRFLRQHPRTTGCPQPKRQKPLTAAASNPARGVTSLLS